MHNLLFQIEHIVSTLHLNIPALILLEQRWTSSQSPMQAIEDILLHGENFELREYKNTSQVCTSPFQATSYSSGNFYCVSNSTFIASPRADSNAKQRRTCLSLHFISGPVFTNILILRIVLFLEFSLNFVASWEIF